MACGGCGAKRAAASGSPGVTGSGTTWTFTGEDGSTVTGTENQARAAQINASREGKSGTLSPSR
jgi:hypothetical protein